MAIWNVQCSGGRESRRVRKANSSILQTRPSLSNLATSGRVSQRFPGLECFGS